MEARKTHQRHMAGYAVGMLLHPSKGIRDDIVRAGGKPKDHMKENVRQLRSAEKTYKQKKAEEGMPSPPPFKLKEFSNVLPRISTRRPQTKSDSIFPNTPDSSRPCTASTDSSKGSKKNFININYTRVRSASNSKPTTPAPAPSNDPKHKLGQVPKYDIVVNKITSLVIRKHQWAQQEEQRIMALEQDKIPKGMMLLKDIDRLRTLHGLKSRRDELLDDLTRFPVIIELASTKARKSKIESDLVEIDQGIQIFSRAKVFVPKDAFEQTVLGQR